MPSLPRHRIAVIGDIHGNIHALDAAIRHAAEVGYDEMVLLGDLPTYGVDTAAVIERVGELCAREGVTLLRGNHDAEYLDADVAPHAPDRPDWIRESIDFTRASLPAAEFRRLPFVDEYRTEGIFFAHANPYGREDWRYLNTEEDHAAALDVLELQGLSIGVFGHTHRARAYRRNGPGDATLGPADRIECERRPMAGCILNAGSIGQPRDRVRAVHVLFLESTGSRIVATFSPFEYNIRDHLTSIRNSTLSEATKRRLVAFHEDRAPHEDAGR